jgi:predicted RNase H-like nuclease (RuvC/YqgF family)
VIQQGRSEKTERPSDPDRVDHEQRIRALERRVEELESLLEGLQDSVHRETARQAKEIEALEAKTQPPVVARDLDRYSRERGL